MIRIEARFDVKLISADALAGYMEFRGVTVRDLAVMVGGEHLRSTIGHLRSGRRDSCPPELARKIEKALNAPRNSLFVAKVSTVQRETARSAA